MSLRVIKEIPLSEQIGVNDIKPGLFRWAEDVFKKNSNSPLLWLDSNNYPQLYSSYQATLAIGTTIHNLVVERSDTDSLTQLDQFVNTTQDWLFGYLGYSLAGCQDIDFKNPNSCDFPDVYLFNPLKLVFISDNIITFSYHHSVADDIVSDLQMIELLSKKSDTFISSNILSKNLIHSEISEESYLEKVNAIKQHLKRGDIYEMNFCQEFYVENIDLDIFSTYSYLNKISNPPFASLLLFDNKAIISASPERFLRKQNDKLISQPIKGTAKRLDSFFDDLALKRNLRDDPKERSENIMIVDLVRNDLSQIALPSTVEVEELCKVYSFDQVHQMISTVTARVSKSTTLEAILSATFPMGSMTGAPKLRAMQLIEDYETTRRTAYSGALGYITPCGDFDFSVVIRSILYNALSKYTSISVGSAITAPATAETEYEECLIKADALFKALRRLS